MKKTALILSAPFAVGLLLSACSQPADAPADETTTDEAAPDAATMDAGAGEGDAAEAPAEGTTAPEATESPDERTPPIED